MTLTHEKLVAWQRADDLFIAIHALASRLPEIERFALASQMRRAAYSVPANIVEGMARRSLADRARFLNIAEASLAEVNYCIHVCRRLQYLGEEDCRRYQSMALQTGAPLAGLIRQLKRIPD